jgi:hypothetical protein
MESVHVNWRAGYYFRVILLPILIGLPIMGVGFGLFFFGRHSFICGKNPGGKTTD